MAAYGLIGRFSAAPGQRDALVGILLEAAALLTGSRGCRLWLVHTDATDPDRVWVVEEWDSEDDHDASLERPEVRALIGRAMPLMGGAPEGWATTPRGGLRA